jgi:SAM-dependent methyltransferase
MSLESLINNNTTDKNTYHTYLETYETLFQKKRDDNVNILEVGIYHGGSIKLWRDYFQNGTIYGLDICDRNFVVEKDILTDNRVKLFFNTDAYNNDFTKQNLASIQFDFVIDDGPHTLDSMKFFVEHYSNLLKEDGVLVVEDVADFSWIEILTATTPEHLRQYIKVVDLRDKKNRFDDLMFIIDKSMTLA